jgi:hypothetical protein
MKARRNPPDPLRSIPGVGPSIAGDLRELGIRRVEDLKGRDPERLYARSNVLRGEVQDRCLLYVFRCAVYFATTRRPDPELLKWWNWKDAAPGSAGGGRGPGRSTRKPETARRGRRTAGAGDGRRAES